MDFKDLKIIIPTCDRYIHAVEGLMYTLNKYFNIYSKYTNLSKYWFNIIYFRIYWCSIW